MVNKNKTSVPWPRRHKWLTCLAVIVIMIVILVIVGALLGDRSLEKNKQSFVDARKNIDSIYADVTKQIGIPDNQKRTSTCSSGYSGPYHLITNCVVSTDFIYGVKSHQEALTLSDKIEAVIQQRSDLFHKAEGPKAGITNTPAPSNYSDSDLRWYKTVAGLSCSYGYVFDNPSSTKLSFRNLSKNLKTFFASIDCTGEAKAQYYPSTNN